MVPAVGLPRSNVTGIVSRKHLLDGIDGTLKRLGTDYVDLYQIHRPLSNTPIDETLRALDDMVRQGKQIQAKEGFIMDGLKELGDCRIGLVGFGAIARATARLLTAFGSELVIITSSS